MPSPRRPTTASALPAASGSWGRSLPSFTENLFLVFSALVVVPVIDVPLMGVSATAPVITLVALEVLFRARGISLGSYSRWLILGYAFWTGVLVSVAGNSLIQTFSPDMGDLVQLVRFGYWIIVFIITTIVVSWTSTAFLGRLSLVLGAGATAIACLRLSEAILYGRWGAGFELALFSQNSYGILFSTFSPFVFLLAFRLKGRWRAIGIGAVVVLIIAIAGNGSRSSWIAVALGALTFVLLKVLAQPRRVGRVMSGIVVLLALFAVAVSIAPPAVLEPIAARYAQLAQAEEDKSWAIRLLMNQKGERLFAGSPLFGAGIGRFRSSSVPLDLPYLLTYASQESFDTKSAHNSYLALLGETGLAGTLPFVLLILILALNGLGSSTRLARAGQLWAIAMYAAFIGMSLHLWTLSGLTDTQAWFVYGMVAGVVQRSRTAVDLVAV